MQYFFFIINSALSDFRRNKVRTFLTSLGILIGVFSVVLLMALGLGLKKYIENQFESLGANLIMVIPGAKGTMLQGGGMVGGIKFDERDVEKIKRISTVSFITGAFGKPGSKISANGKSEIAEIVGSNEEISQIMNLEAVEGRLFEKKDIQKGSKIILVYTRLAEKLFGTAENVVGKNVVVNKQSFKITGVLKSKGGGIGGGNIDHQVFIPFKASYPFNPDKKYYGIYLKAVNKEAVAETKSGIETILQKRYDKDEFSVMDEKEILDMVTTIFAVINSILIAIAAISLVVGGIGIMNIMYVTVTEKIREIGIRRAIGARKSDILYLFLIQSIILSLFGGILGLALAYLITLAIQTLFPAYIDLGAVALALGMSTGIGVIFGVFPAKKAADLLPIEAIRYE